MISIRLLIKTLTKPLSDDTCHLVPHVNKVIKILPVIIAASFLFFSGPADAAPRPGQAIPNFKVISTTGQPLSRENYRDHVLILDFFATWCQPCRKSIPHLVDMNRKYGKQGLQVLGLNVDEEGERTIKKFADEFRVNYPLAPAGNSVTADFGISSVPVMYLIDKKGKVVEVYRGFSDEKALLMEKSIKRLLSEK